MEFNKKTHPAAREQDGKANALPEKRRRALYLVNVCTLMAVFAAVALFMTFGQRPNASDVEKRNLEKCPTFSWESYWSGEFTDQFSKFYNDTVPARSTWKLAISRFRKLMGIQGGVSLIGDASTQFPSAPKPQKPTTSKPAGSESVPAVNVPDIVVPPAGNGGSAVSAPESKPNGLPTVVVRPPEGYESESAASAETPGYDLPTIVVRPPADDNDE